MRQNSTYFDFQKTTKCNCKGKQSKAKAKPIAEAKKRAHLSGFKKFKKKNRKKADNKLPFVWKNSLRLLKRAHTYEYIFHAPNYTH